MPDPLECLTPETVTVCSECLRASCWQGVYYCEKARTAGTREMTVATLRRLHLEHPRYWRAQK
jgi:hypothetical protein